MKQILDEERVEMGDDEKERSRLNWREVAARVCEIVVAVATAIAHLLDVLPSIGTRFLFR